MSGFVDRRLADKDPAIKEMDQMDRQIASYAERFGLAGSNLPKVIGASDQNAWVGTKYLIAWGSELDAWERQAPHNYTVHYPSKANPADLGGMLERELLEGQKLSEKDLHCIALMIGRAREMQSIGRAQSENPLWSYAASTFTKAVVLEELKSKGQLDLRNPKLKLEGPVIGLSFKSPWTESLQSIKEGRTSISGTITIPRAMRSTLQGMEGKPLSELISGQSYETIVIQNIYIEPDWMDEDSNEISLTITMKSKFERLGKVPDGMPQEGPIEHWLNLARD